MKILIYYAFVLSIIFYSCRQVTVEKVEKVEKVENSYFDKKSYEIFKGVNYQIVVIDSCEYIMGRDNSPYNGGYFLSHKGNCKFCLERNKK